MQRVRAAVLLALCVAAVNFALMPAEFLRGDPRAWREETRSLLLRGELNVPSAYATQYGEAGQYFARNGHTGLYYSKYGVGNTLFTAPPMWIEHITGGDISAVGSLPSLFLFNVWYVGLSAFLAALLYMLAARYSQRPMTRALYVIGVLYCTSLWFYQRAQSSELYQVILFVGLFMGLSAFLRRLSDADPRGLATRDWGWLGLVWCCAGLLVLTRIVYVLLLPLIVLLAVYADLARRRNGVQSYPRGLAVALLVPPILIGATVAMVNVVKFGAPWLTGYHQWRPEIHLPTSRLFDGLWGFLFSPRFSIFLYFPPVAFALLGLPRFARRYRLDTVAMLAIFAVFLFFLSTLPSWAGEWTYGPRYLLFILPVLSLPFLTLVDQLLAHPDAWRGPALSLAMAVSLAYSAYLQMQVNRLPFFMYYEARVAATSPESIAYFYDRHIGVICADLIRHRDNLEGLPYFADVKRYVSAQDVSAYREMLAGRIARGNLYWALSAEERR